MCDKLKQILQDKFQLFTILPTICGIFTIAICYILAVGVYDHIPSWLYTPEISLLGCKKPEQIIYQIGFSITFIALLLFFFSYRYFLNAIIGDKVKYKWSKFIMLYSIIGASIGLLIQGLITMTEEPLNYLEYGNMSEWKPDSQSIIHQSFAALLFIFAVIHQITVIQFYFRAKDIEQIKNLKCSKWFKLCLLIIGCIVAIFSFSFHPISDTERSQLLLNIAGICQWIAVLCVLIFFSFYAMDYHWISQIPLDFDHVESDNLL